MPNHIHGIVSLGANPDFDIEVAINVDATESVASTFMATPAPRPSALSRKPSSNRRQPTAPSTDRIAPALGEIVRALKAASTTQIRKHHLPTFAWQPNYWDRIIRNDAELERYRVRPGDTLWEIAKRRDTTVKALRAINRLRSEHIVAGQTLLVPAE